MYIIALDTTDNEICIGNLITNMETPWLSAFYKATPDMYTDPITKGAASVFGNILCGDPFPPHITLVYTDEDPVTLTHETLRQKYPEHFI